MMAIEERAAGNVDGNRAACWNRNCSRSYQRSGLAADKVKFQSRAGTGSHRERGWRNLRPGSGNTESRAVGHSDVARTLRALDFEFAGADGGQSAVSIRACERQYAGTQFGERAATAGERVR